jgi:gliding motility-associated-like protein
MYNFYTPSRRLAFLFLLAMLGFANRAAATHSTGADIQYTWLYDNTYRITLNFYRDCAGIDAPTAPVIRIRNCSGVYIDSIALTQTGPPTPVLAQCAGAAPTLCNGGTALGIERYTYSGIITLPNTPCANWIFSFLHRNRNFAIDDIVNPGGQALYVEAMLNNAAVPNNNSADFTTEPVPYICSGFPFTFNHGAFDADGDSLAYSMITPRNNFGSNVTYLPGFSAANPITTTPPNSTQFNNQNGQLSFTPNGIQDGIVAILVREFRNGVLIGSTVRDMQVIVRAGSCNNSSPTFATPSNVSGGSFNSTTQTFRVCPGSTLNFSTVVSDPNTANILSVSYGGNLTGAIVTVSGGTSTPGPRTVSVSWTPTVAQAGNQSINFQVRDNSCPTNGQGSAGFTVVVPGVEAVVNRNDVCLGQNRTFNLSTIAYGGTTGTYQWSAVPAATFSSTTLPNPSVTVSQPTIVTVRYTIGSCIVQDTIMIRAYSNLVLTPNAFTYCAGGAPVQLDANYVNNYTVPATHVCGPFSGAACTGAANLLAVGNGTTTTGTGNSFGAGSPYQGNQNGRVQYIYTAAELTAAGISAGLLRKMAFFVSNKNTNFTYNGFTIKIQCTSKSTFATNDDFGTIGGTWTTVYVGSPPTTTSWNEYAFVQPYDWDGVQNIAIEICYDRGQSASAATGFDHVQTTNAANRVLYSYGAYRPFNSSSNRCGDNRIGEAFIPVSWFVDGGGRSSNRPNIRFDYCDNLTPNITYTWSPPLGLSATNIKNPTANPAAAGPHVYTVTATDGICPQTASVTVTTTPCNVCTANAGIVPLPTEITCSNASFNLNAAVSSPIITGGATPTTWAWTGPAGLIPSTSGGNTPTPNISAGGTYTVTMTNTVGGNTCSSTAAIIVAANNIRPLVVVDSAAVFTCVTSQTTLNATVTPTTSTYTYQWARSNGSQTGILSGTTTPNPLVNALGTYLVTVTNTSNGCTQSGSVTVGNNITLPDPIIAAPPYITCNPDSITLNASASTNAQEFSWSGPTPLLNGIRSGGLSPTPTVNLAGTYTVTITGNNGCTNTGTIVVQEDKVAPVSPNAPNAVLLCNSPNGAVSIGAQSITPNVMYAWDNGLITFAQDVDVAATYTVTITSNTNGCTITDEVVVTADITPPNVNIGQPQLLTCGIVTVTLGGAPVPGVTYSWSSDVVGGGFTSAINIPNPTVNAPGTYTVVVQNPLNGCTNSASIVVSQNLTPPNANAGVPAVLTCANPCTNIGVISTTSPVTYDWGGGIITPTRNVCGIGTYTVTVTSTANGCTATSGVTITQNLTPPNANAGTGGVITCLNATTGVIIGGNPTSTAGAIFDWSGPGIVADIANPTVTVIGTYTVLVTNPVNGCTASSITQVTPNFDTPTPNAGLSQTLNCNPTTVVQIGTPAVAGISYQWATNSTNPTPFVGNTNIAQPSVSAPGTYTVTATNDLTGCASNTSVVITQNITPPNANAGLPQVVTCINAISGVTLGGSPTSTTPGATFNWTSLGGSTSSNPPNITTAGDYSVIVTDPSNGCTQISTVNVSINQTAPDANAGPDITLTCAITNATLTGNPTSTVPNATYLWCDGSTGPTRFVTISNIGICTVTVTNPANGCTATDEVEVFLNNTPPNANAGPNKVRTCTNQTVSIGLASTTTPVTYNWSGTPGGATPSITVGADGNYTVTVVDTNNGCSATDEVQVTSDFSTPIVSAGADQIITCANLCVNIGVASPSPNVTYLWSNGATTAVQNVCTAGTYTVTVTNDPLNGGNGCTAADVVVVTENKVLPNANAGADAIITCVSPSATIGVVSTTPGVTYLWDGGPNPTSATQVISTPATYTVIVTSQINGCSTIDAVTVTQNTTQPLANAGPAVTLNCTNPNSIIGTPAVLGNTYQWGSTLGGSVGFVTPTNQAQPRINLAATYTVTVTNTINGCTSTSVVIVTPDFAQPNANAGADQITTCTNPSVTLGQVSSTVGATYRWSGSPPSPITATISVQNIGLYTVTVTGPNGCTASDVVLVTQNKVVPNANAGVDKIITCTNSSALIGVASTTAGVTYLWSNNISSATQTVNPTTPTIYTVTVTNPANGCTNTDDVSITINTTLPNANAGLTKELRCNQTSVQIGVISTTPNVLYAWNNGAGSGAQPTVSQPNIYTVTVTAQNGCSSISTVIVSEDKLQPNANAGIDKQLDCVTTSVSIGVASTTVNHSVTYLWSNGATTATQNVNTAGIYTVTVTDTYNGCKGTDNVTVSANLTPPIARISTPTPITCTVLNSTLNANTSTPITTRAFLWPDGSTGATFIAPNPGPYCVTVTNTANGCTASSCVTVINNIGGVQAVIRPTQTLTCSRNSVTLDACTSVPLGTAVFDWGNGVTTCTTSATVAATYTVTITNPANGCTATGTTVVIEDRVAPNANAGPPVNLTCANTCVNVGLASTTSPVRYIWSNSGGLNPAANFCQVGTYTVTVTDLDNNCTATDDVTIGIDITPPSADAGLDQELTCIAGNVNLTASSATTTGVTYQWGSNTGVIGANPIVNVSQQGTYTVTVTSDLNGCTAIDFVQVNLNRTPPNVDAGPTVRLSCVDLIGTVGGIPTTSTTPSATFVWGGTVPVVGDATLNSANVSSAGIYTVTVTNPANGCTASDNVLVVADRAAPNANAGPDKQITCNNPSTTIGLPSQTNGVSYQWSTNINDNAPFVTVSPNATTVYTVSVTNPLNGCVATDEVTVVGNNTLPIIDIEEPAQLTCQVNTVTISAANSSPAGVTFLWSFGNSTNSAIEVSAAGIYTVTVTNLLTGCVASSTKEVTQAGSVPLVAAAVTNINCNGNQNGSIDLTMSGGRPPFRYVWENNGGQEDRTNLAPGTYTVIITDANLCSIGTTVVITQPARLLATTTATPSQCANDGAVAVSAIGGVAPYTYQWGNIINNTTQSVPGLSAADYFVTVTDRNLCTVTATATVTRLFNIATDTTVTKVRCYGGADGQIQLAINGDYPPFTLQWSYGNSVANPIVGLPVGNYIVTITDANGCQSVENYYMRGVEPMQAIPQLTNPKCNAACDGQIYLDMVGGNGGYVFAWGRAGEYSAYLNAVCAGTYSVTITDQKGCTYSPSPYTITQPDAVVVDNILIQQPSCNGSYDGVLTPTASGGTPGYQYDWGGNIGLGIARNLPRGNYTVTVSDINGCSTYSSVAVPEPPPIVATITQIPMKCTGDESGEIIINNASGGNGGPFTYSINNAAQQQTTNFSPLNPGLYYVHVYDVNNCQIIEQQLIREPSPLIIDAGGPFTIQMGDSVHITPAISGAFNPLYEFRWTAVSPGTTASIGTPNTLETTVHPLQTTTYIVKVTDASRGCEATDRVLVEVTNPLNVYVPNIFTPDGSGLNDRFTVFAGLGIEKVVTLRIFDRWGDLVFENQNFQPNDEKSGWDGTFKGQKMNPTTYVYYIELELSNGKKQVLSGDVTLMR